MQDNDTYPIDLRVFPTKNRCRRQVRLDKAGKPVNCGRPGYAIIDGQDVPLCALHFHEQRPAIEAIARKIGD